MEQEINFEQTLDEVVELANTCIEWDFEEFDHSYFIKHLNEKFIIIKRETATISPDCKVRGGFIEP